MIWVKLAMTAWFTLGVVVTIRDIGKPRKPISSGIATASAITTALIILAIWVM